jgi:CBS domain containing-hemolysin-like protein
MSKESVSTARDLLSKRVVVVDAENRLHDVVAEITAADASHCAVIDKKTDGKFIGVVRLKDIASKSAHRIFADLVSSSMPLDIQESLEANVVFRLMQARGSDEVVVMNMTREYVGLITRESLLEWWLAELKRAEKKKD